MTLTVVCAWCGLVLKTGSDPKAPVSHGICPACLAKMQEKEEKTLSPTSDYDINTSKRSR